MSSSPQPGWYPDPSGSANVRWWDGNQWTEHTQQPAAAPQPAAAAAPHAGPRPAGPSGSALQASNTSPVVLLTAPYQHAFDTTVRVLPQLKMKVKGVDPATGTITASTGFSWASYGEDVFVRLQAADEAHTNLWVEAQLKFGMVDVWGRHKKNFEKIVDAVQRSL